MALEIERKFLVKGDWKSLAKSSTRIIQGYFPVVGGCTIRVRLRDDKGYLTIKGPSTKDGLERYEFEKEISEQEAKELLTLCIDARIDKCRWLVPCGKHTFEVDEFFGENEGLIIAEVELSSSDEAFDKPDFIGEEVTGQKKYYNSRLILEPYSKWTDK